jgi:hypothetical protein
VREVAVVDREPIPELVATLVASSADPAELDRLTARLDAVAFIQHASWGLRSRIDRRDRAQLGARSRPYLSTLQPHFGHVQPPHIASSDDIGLRIIGRRSPQRGQEVPPNAPMPHCPWRPIARG